MFLDKVLSLQLGVVCQGLIVQIYHNKNLINIYKFNVRTGGYRIDFFYTMVIFGSFLL